MEVGSVTWFGDLEAVEPIDEGGDVCPFNPWSWCGAFVLLNPFTVIF